MPDASPSKRKLHHLTPAWVPMASVFHLRCRCEKQQLAKTPLTDPTLGKLLLDSAILYHTRQRWRCHLFLIMPDHLHALISFPMQEAMSRVIGDWKHYHALRNHIVWQDGYFDHRIRNGHEFELKADYIRKNPVVKGLCRQPIDWSWVCTPALSES